MALGAHRRTYVLIAGSITLCGPPARSLEPIRCGRGGNVRVDALCPHIPASQAAHDDHYRSENQAIADETAAFERTHKPVFGLDNVEPFTISLVRPSEDEPDF